VTLSATLKEEALFSAESGEEGKCDVRVVMRGVT
jgi:hypothetical protein